MIGRTLSHYRILEQLGEGGMGRVYLAEDLELQRRVALKVLPDEVSDDKDRLERFLREAKTVAQLNHPNIVTIHSVETGRLEPGDPPLHFITMERVDGRRLTDLIPSGGQPLEQLFDILIQLSEAVSAAHERGVTHRDLKPSNVMVTDDGHVKVLDFGLAKTTDLPPGADGTTELATATLTSEGKVLGTVAYMSPQQAEAKPLDHRTDVFSLGIVMFEMATGQRPFQAETPVGVMTSILRDTPPPATELRPEIPNHLARIINHCLEKDPKDRFQTARDVHNELRRLSEEIAASRTAERRAATATWVLDPPRRRRFALPVLFVLLAAAAGLIAYFLVGRISGTIGAARQTRLAVLPLSNLTGDPNQVYLAQGISSFLINQLSEVPELSVLSQSYVNSYDSAPEGVRRLVRDSAVDAYVEGHLERRGETLRVYVNLTAADDGSIINAMDFDGTADAIFDLQSQIVRAISTELAVDVSAKSLAWLERAPPTSNAAFLHFLEGLPLLSPVDNAAVAARAESLFRRAVREDPRFAYGHWGLSRALLNEVLLGDSPDLLGQAESAAKAALALDPGLHRARITLAAVYREGGRLEEAIAELEPLAREQRPPQTLFEELAVSYGEMGDLAGFDESLERALAQRSDSEVYRDLADSYAIAGQTVKALEFFEKAVEADRGSWLNHNGLGVFLLTQGEFERARTSLERARSLAPEEQMPLKNLGRLALAQFKLKETIEVYQTIPAAEIDAATASNLGTAYFYHDAPGSLDKAEEYYSLATRLRPKNFQLQANLGDLYVRQGRAEEARDRYGVALALVEEQLEELPGKILLRVKQPVYLAKVDACDRAVPLAEELDPALPRSIDNVRSIAQAFALCAATDRAIEAIEELVRLGYPAQFLPQEDEFKSLHGHPRFKELGS